MCSQPQRVVYWPIEGSDLNCNTDLTTTRVTHKSDNHMHEHDFHTNGEASDGEMVQITLLIASQPPRY